MSVAGSVISGGLSRGVPSGHYWAERHILAASQRQRAPLCGTRSEGVREKRRGLDGDLRNERWGQWKPEK